MTYNERLDKERYAQNMFEPFTQVLYSSNNINIKSCVYDKDTKEGYYTIMSIGKLDDKDYKEIRIFINKPEYQSHSDDILTKEQFEIFNKVIHDKWDDFLINTKELYQTVLNKFYPKLPMKLPTECPDFSKLEVK